MRLRIGHEHFRFPYRLDAIVIVFTLGLAVPLYYGWRLFRFIGCWYGRDITGERIEFKPHQLVRPEEPVDAFERGWRCASP